MIKKILKACLIIFIAYVLLVVNVAVVGLIYIKLNPSYADLKAPLPFGIIGLILVVIEFYIFYKYRALKKK